MIGYMLHAAVVGSTLDQVDPTDTEVLAICQHHGNLAVFNAARDTFIKSQGLYDFNQAVIRLKIAEDRKAVGLLEVRYREEGLRQFFTGIGRLYNVGMDYWELFNLIIVSDNWRTQWNRLTQINPVQLATSAWITYSQVSQLYAQQQYEAAGEALSNGLFPENYPVTGNVKWPPLQFKPVYPGEEIAGILAGFIFKFTGEHNSDNLAACVGDRDLLVEDFNESTGKLYSRYNDGIAESMAHVKGTILGLTSFISRCSEQTQTQVEKMEKIALEIELDEDVIVSNLRDNKGHVELLMAKMKMQHTVHDFFEYGMNFADIYLTLVTH